MYYHWLVLIISNFGYIKIQHNSKSSKKQTKQMDKPWLFMFIHFLYLWLAIMLNFNIIENGVSRVGEHISLGICVSQVGEHISLGICVAQVAEHMSLGIRVSQVGEHISLGICTSQVGEHISLGIRVSWVGEHISLGICVSQVGEHKSLEIMCFPGGGTHITSVFPR